MDTIVFNTIMKNLTDTTAECQTIRKLTIEGTSSITRLSDEDYHRMIAAAQRLHSKMDKIMQNEVYHLIGMGNMSVIQMSKFTAAVKKLGEYRTTIKLVASLTGTTTHKGLTLGDSTYKSELAETVLSVPSGKKED